MANLPRRTAPQATIIVTQRRNLVCGFGRAALLFDGRHWPKHPESPMKAQLESPSWEQSLTTVLEKLRALDAQRAQLLDGAKKEALDKAEKAVAELNELGFHYSLVEGAAASTASPARAPRKAPSHAPKRQARDLPCPICKFKTTPHHDGRMHRSQKTKKPFTVEELMEKGLTKVG
jgi:hypothetical protein